jgi:flagellar export protein FliJ
VTRRSRLGPVLRLSRMAARAALRKLGEARLRAAQAQDRLDALEAQRARTRARLALAPGHVVPVAELRADRQAARALERAAQGAAAQLDQVRREEARERDTALRARLRVRALERALERRLQRERLEAARRETRRLDAAVLAAQEEEPGHGA